MNAQEVTDQLDEIIQALTTAKDNVEGNDTLSFDLSRKLNLLDDVSAEVVDYVQDQI